MANHKNNSSGELHQLFVLQYLVRLTSELENRIKEMKRNMDLNNLDAVDIIDYIETLAAYRMAIQIEQEIVQILSWRL